MKLLNHTTQIAPEKTILEIQQLLVKAGARQFNCEYDDDGVLFAVSFAINTNRGTVGFKLPAHIDKVHTILKKSKRVDRNKYRTREQAARTAWRIIKVWVQSQVAMIQVGMVEIEEVFLPYALTANGQTVYELFQEKGLQMIAYNGGDNGRQ